jgi:superfamily II DNA or RNA helicase
VDIPSINNAIILSSSQNERQYIQRRGRVLRLSPETNKRYSRIYDAVVSPNKIESSEDYYPFLSYELKRADKFADHALNQTEAKSKLSILKILNLQSLVDEGEEGQ